MGEKDIESNRVISFLFAYIGVLPPSGTTSVWVYGDLQRSGRDPFAMKQHTLYPGSDLCIQ